MSCRQARAALVHGSGDDAAVARHLERCDDCARFADRWHELRSGLRRHRAAAVPDAGFAGRVTARLPAAPDALAWAVARLLPASAALVLALTGWCLLATPAPPSLADELAGDDLLAWVADEPEGER